MKVLLESTERYDLNHITGKTRFRGCQCFKDCTCNEDFKPEDLDYYTVKKKFNKVKTTNHSTLGEAHERIKFLETIPINYWQGK